MLFLVGVVAWVLLVFIFFCQNTDSSLIFFLTYVPSTSAQGSMRPIDAAYVENNTSIEHLNLSVDESWADKVVRGLWMGWASSDMLSSYLQNAKKNYIAINQYKVNYTGHWKKQMDRKKLLCQLKQQELIRTLNGSEEPFTSLGWQKLVPHQPLEQAINGPYRTCAVVSSAGAILNSSLGREIGEWLGFGCKQDCIDKHLTFCY